MKTVNRRELNQQSGKILDDILATGELVEVLTRGAGSVVISRKEGTHFDEWVRLGLVEAAIRDVDGVNDVGCPPMYGRARRRSGAAPRR